MPSNFTNDAHAWGGRTTAVHIPPQPLWLLILRGVQIFFSLLALALSAYGLSVFGGYSGYGMTIFTAIWTWGFIAYITVTAFKFPAAYNMWAHLGLEIATTVFWLTSFALLANLTSAFSYIGYYDGTYFYYGKSLSGAIGATKAATAFAALVWVSFIVSLVIFGINLHRTRTSAGFLDSTGGGVAAGGVTAGEEHKLEPVVGQQPVAQTYTPHGQVPVGQQYTPAGQTPYPAGAQTGPYQGV